MDVAAFYGILAGLSFTLLGLWWVACQARMSWLVDRVGRGMAYVVSLHFVLPGAMSLLSLVAPDVPALWRITFATAGAAGIVGTVLLAVTVRRRTRDVPFVAIVQWIAVPLYALVTLVALAPGITATWGLSALQTEGIVLVLLVLLGTQSAWLVTFAATGVD